MCNERWYSVRGLFYDEANRFYEERITLFKAVDSAGVLDKAELASKEYAEDLGEMIFTGYLETFELVDDIAAGLSEGVEVFSCMRYSDLSPEDYIKQFLQTGQEVNLQEEDRA